MGLSCKVALRGVAFGEQYMLNHKLKAYVKTNVN